MSSTFRRYTGKPSTAQQQPSIKSLSDNPIPTVAEAPCYVVAPSLRGTKPWTGGSNLTSCGLRELDGVLGGGQPIGTCLLIEEDRLTDLGLVLARYWAAEALAQRQYLLLVETKADIADLPSSIPSSLDYDDDVMYVTRCYGTSLADLQSFVDKIPRDAHLDKYRDTVCPSNDKKTTNNATSHIFESIVEEDGPEEAKDDIMEDVANENDHDDEGLLKIAWQYKLSVQNARYQKKTAEAAKPSTKYGDVYCHSYDLSARMRDQYPSTLFDLKKQTTTPSVQQQDVNIGIVDVSAVFKGKNDIMQATIRGIRLFRSLITRIEREIVEDERTVLRLLLLNVPACEMSVALPLLLSAIRQKKLAVVLCITVRPSSASSFSTIVGLQRASDFVFSIDGFESFRTPPPSEFRNLTGIFHVHKLLKSLNHFANRQATAPRYGLSRDGRKLHLQMLHLPPEDFSSGGSSVGGGGARTGGGATKNTALEAGVSCGSSVSRGSSSLDF